MDSKGIGISFCLQVVIQYAVVFGLSIYYIKHPVAEGMSITGNLILSQMMNVVPVMFVVLLSRRRQPEKIVSGLLGFRRIKGSTALMMVLYTFLVMPLATLANAFSMIFVDNTVAGLAGDILNVPFFVMFPLMAVFGPFCEELVFRGVFYRGFRKSGNIFGAVILSSLLFALMHMNFNQAAYAFLLGIMMALAAEATGSTLSTFIMHFIYNAQSVCLMYLEEYFFPEKLLEELENYSYTTEDMVLVVSIYLFLAVVCTAIAFCALAWMAENEGKQNFLRTVWESRKVRREKLWSGFLIVGVALSALFMLFDAFMEYFTAYY